MAKLLEQHKKNIEYLRHEYQETGAGPSFQNIISVNSVNPDQHIITPDDFSYQNLVSSSQTLVTSGHSSSVEQLEYSSDQLDLESEDIEIYNEDEFYADVDGRSDFVIGIAKWISESKVSRDSCNSLLKFLNENGHPDNPKDVSTIMKTPLQKIQLKNVHPGLYYHFGIQNHFAEKYYSFLDAPSNNKVEIDIGIDGAKVFNASKITIWPIIGAFVNKPNLSPFLIGCYTGKHQPKDPNVFVEDLCNEISLLQKRRY